MTIAELAKQLREDYPNVRWCFDEINGYYPRSPKKQKKKDEQISLLETFGCEQTNEELPFVEVRDD